MNILTVVIVVAICIAWAFTIIIAAGLALSSRRSRELEEKKDGTE